MTFDWQEGAALTLVTVAVVYLGRLSWLALFGNRAGSCGGGCHGCCGSSPDDKPIVLIKPLPPAVNPHGDR